MSASHTCRPGPDALGSRANSHEDAWVRLGGSVPGRVGMPTEPPGMSKHTQLPGASRSQWRAARVGWRPGQALNLSEEPPTLAGGSHIQVLHQPR